MNNLSSYYGLVDARIRASDKDLPVKKQVEDFSNFGMSKYFQKNQMLGFIFRMI